MVSFPKPGEYLSIGSLHGSASGLLINDIFQALDAFLLIITPESSQISPLSHSIQFFCPSASVTTLPNWEILPYDIFSPHSDITSERLSLLYQLPLLKKGILLASINTLMHYFPPRHYLHHHSFVLKKGQTLHLENFKKTLETNGYHLVSQVMAHGEYAVRGSLLDVFPMGGEMPYRIDFFDEEVDSLRLFDPDTQRTLKTVSEINLLPAHEFPLNPESIKTFKTKWREHFSVNPLEVPYYQNVSRGEAAPGLEYYLSLFFEKTDSFFDYLPQHAHIILIEDVYQASQQFWQEINERYQQVGHDRLRPILPPSEVCQSPELFFHALKKFPHYRFTQKTTQHAQAFNFPSASPPQFTIDRTHSHPFHTVVEWREKTAQKVLFSVETLGRLEVILPLLHQVNIFPTQPATWEDFLSDPEATVGIIISPLEEGLDLQAGQFPLSTRVPSLDNGVVIVTESQLFGPQVMQRHRRKGAAGRTSDTLIRDLTEITLGMPVVHIDHGVGRYMGLQVISTGDQTAEYLVLHYFGDAKLYVPVASLHLISRYTGVDAEHAPLHKLGSPKWEKTKQKAKEKIRDVAAELLHIYAQRAAQKGFAFTPPDEQYAAFCSQFPFETTADQQTAIDAVTQDMISQRPMDRVICGDVGFGKTEVAMRAAFLATQSHQQVAVLVPTTLLAEQHLHSFQDRFAQWPIRIAAFSRFRTPREQKALLEDMALGKIDIVIGTHKLLQPQVIFKSLGLLIVDEEHRFGVAQKERIKSLRASVDLLTLTATPIPRTLNMALASIRDLSVISTPPAKRLSIKTFVREYQVSLIKEAVRRETLRGGQVYFVHNEVNHIDRIAAELQTLLPETRIGIAHGQLRESELERVMADFYHQRFHILVCTTIIESGIDVPTANTILIRRADCFGLAQLHQLRGRVGRSHHQAYAYLLTPPGKTLTPEAKKRLEAISTLEQLGSGFLLATQDLEIRGAGELLGDEQSGHIQEMGFSLYTQLLEETVTALKSGEEPLLEKRLGADTEIDFGVPALLPDTYLPDVQARLVVYRRLANVEDTLQLEDLKAEIIDRFGPLPVPVKNLFQINAFKLFVKPLGILKMYVKGSKALLKFNASPRIHHARLIEQLQKFPQRYQFKEDSQLAITLKEEELALKIKELMTFLTPILSQ